jgi:hypothetical protein
VTTPSLRRLAFRATRIWLGSSMLAYLVNTTPGVVEAAPPVYHSGSVKHAMAPLVVRPDPNLTRFTTRNHSPHGIQVAGSFSETETAVAWISFTAIIVVN